MPDPVCPFAVLLPRSHGYELVGLGATRDAAVEDAARRTDHGREFLRSYVVTFAPPPPADLAGHARALAATLDPLFDATVAACNARDNPPAWRAVLGQLANAQAMLRAAGADLAALERAAAHTE